MQPVGRSSLNLHRWRMCLLDTVLYGCICFFIFSFCKEYICFINNQTNKIKRRLSWTPKRLHVLTIYLALIESCSRFQNWKYSHNMKSRCTCTYTCCEGNNRNLKMVWSSAIRWVFGAMSMGRGERNSCKWRNKELVWKTGEIKISVSKRKPQGTLGLVPLQCYSRKVTFGIFRL